MEVEIKEVPPVRPPRAVLIRLSENEAQLLKEFVGYTNEADMVSKGCSKDAAAFSYEFYSVLNAALWDEE